MKIPEHGNSRTQPRAGAEAHAGGLRAMTTRQNGPDFDPEGNPYNGKYVYVGRKGLGEHLGGVVILHNEKEAADFLHAHPANRLWRCYLGEVTEMDVTAPQGPRLIVREREM
jgi:hypothetical protein